MQHLVLSQDRACAQLFKSRSKQTWVIAAEKKGWWESLGSALQKSLQMKPMGAVLWVHGGFYMWAISVLILAHKISWSYWHSSLCLCVSHPEGSYQWELSQCLPGEMFWPGDCWLKDMFAKLFLSLCASKRLSNTSHDENVTVVCRNPGFSLCLCHGLYRMLSKPHRPNCSAMTTSCFILCAGAASHCSAQS